jgi:hypothetical protein
MRVSSIFLVTGCLLASPALSAPTQPSAEMVERTPKAHPPYGGGVVIVQEGFESDDEIVYPDDESSDDDDDDSDYEVVVEEERYAEIFFRDSQ